MSVKFPFFGFFFLGGGGSADFIFMGARIFLTHVRVHWQISREHSRGSRGDPVGHFSQKAHLGALKDRAIFAGRGHNRGCNRRDSPRLWCTQIRSMWDRHNMSLNSTFHLELH